MFIMATNNHPRIKSRKKIESMNNEKRNREIYELRLSGMRLQDIADKFAITQGWVSQIINSVLEDVKKYNLELGQKLMELELDRLDKLSQALHEKAMVDGDPRAVDSYLRIMERRAKMVSLDKAKDPAELTFVKLYEKVSPDMWDKEE